MRPFAKYLLQHWHLEPETALSLVDVALESCPEPGERSRLFDGEELIRVVLRVYADPGSDDPIRRRAMDVFDKLMRRYSGRANQILEEWDRV